MSTNSSLRINYLIQASEKVAEKCPYLSQYYGQVLLTVAEKSSTKLDLTAKRRLCRSCGMALLPGINCSYRVMKKKSKKGCPTQVITCKNCSCSQKLLCRKGYKLKAETDGKVHKLVIN